MGLFLFPTGWLTPANDGLYSENHEDGIKYFGNLFSALGVPLKNPAFSFIGGSYKALLYLENRYFDPSLAEQIPYHTTLGGPHYDCLR